MSAASKWAPDNDEGLHAYVVTSKSWGKATDRIEYAANLAEAKRRYGWTRMQHTSMSVRRAKAEDVLPVTPRKPVVPLPEWVIALVAAIEKAEARGGPGLFSGGPESRFLALVPEHVRQHARRWSA